MEEKYYTVQEVADKLGVSIETVRRRIREGALPHIALTPKNYRVTESDLQKYLDGCRGASSNSDAIS